MSNEKVISVLLICFIRNSHLEHHLETIMKFGIKTVFVSIDGPRNEIEKRLQNEIFSTLDRYSKMYDMRIHINHFSENLGLSKSIIKSIDWFFENVDFGIILEDDLLISDNFFNFVKESEFLLHKCEDLLLISGNQFDPSRYPEQWSHYPLIWGWATNSEKWKIMKRLIVSKSFPNLRNVTLKSWIFWSLGIVRVKIGLLNSWALPLATHMKSSNFLSYLPSVNLVTHDGFDSLAVHSNRKSIDLKIPLSNLSSTHAFYLTNREIELSADVMDRKLEIILYKISSRVYLGPIKLGLQILVKIAKSVFQYDK